LDTLSDVKRFVRHMTRSAIKGGSLMTLEDISDTPHWQPACATPGMSAAAARLPMLKFFARMGGMRVELILHYQYRLLA
jgi:hypothetical protein